MAKKPLVLLFSSYFHQSAISMSQKHDHQHSDHNPKHESGWKPHTDWRAWAAVLMLVAIVIYILSLDESRQPANNNSPPAAAPN